MSNGIGNLIGRLLLAIFLGYSGVSVILEALSEPLMTDFSEAARPALGGEPLADGSQAISGQMIKPAGKNVSGIMNWLMGLGCLGVSVYVGASAILKFTRRQRLKP